MQEVDYIVVGFGLSGMSFCHILDKYAKRYVVYDNKINSASRVAGGVYNPVILKRYTLPWKAEEQFDYALQFYKELSEKLNTDVQLPLPVQKIFSSIEDQNNWFSASDKEGLKRFLNLEVKSNINPNIQARYKLGEVLETGRVKIAELLDTYSRILKDRSQYLLDNFDHQDIQFYSDHVIYKNIRAKHIVFAEGYGIKNNMFFNNLPLVGNKGEYILIEAPDLKLEEILKSSFFIIPLGESIYKVGASFNWQEKDFNTTKQAKDELVKKLKSVIDCDFKVIDQVAGVRPTTGDRRALLGKHPKYESLALLNGTGTRGIMMAPYLAKLLYMHLEMHHELLPEINLKRFISTFN